jgi:hypothetical protein
MEYSKEANNCVCKADKAPHTITYWFMDDNGTVTQDKKLDICYTPCPEGKVNEIDTYTLKISAPVGETIYSLTPVFTGADKCICPEGLTDSPFGCINAPAKQKECLEQNTTAVNGSFSWDGSDYACPFKCNAGFYELSNGVCRINCDSKGEIATSDGNSCVCDTANHWVPYSGGGCKCEEGHTLSGNACVPDNDPVVECSSDSDCDDNEACKDGECHPKEPEPPGGECDSDTDCGTGMLCSSAKECECDTVNGWVYDSSTGMCEYKEDPAIDIICKLNGGTYIQKEAYCEYDPKVAACKVSGKKWDEAEKACLADDDNERPNTGSGCGNIGSAGLPQNFGALLPYLLILGFVSLRGALATKRSPANK